MSRHACGSSSACLDQLSGTSIVLAIGALRPARTRTSNTASSAALSEDPPETIGLMSSAISPNAEEAILISWLFSQFRLPLRLLISPLCASIRNGCASHHCGNVLVEYR